MGLLDIIEQRESGGKNVPNYKYGPGFSASGNFQMINETWRRWARDAGIDISSYPRAIDAPYEVQRAVAEHGLKTEGTKPWKAMDNYRAQPAGVLSSTETAAAPVAGATMPALARNREELERMLLEKYPELQVTSRDRDPTHNARVGGAKGSQHLHGNALDISVKGLDDAKQEEITRYARSIGARGFGYYPGSQSMHFDTRPSGDAFWGPNYSKTSLDQTKPWFQKFAADPGALAAGQTTPSTPAPATGSPPGVIAADGTAPASPADGLAAFNNAFQAVRAEQSPGPAQAAVQTQTPAPPPSPLSAPGQPGSPSPVAAADLMTSLLERRRALRTPMPRGMLSGWA